jgi:hypothetical protein
MSSNDDDGIYRVDTIPPPAGEDDAYSAPTRVGPMASAIVEEIIAQAKREAEEAAASSRPPGTPTPVEDEAVVIDPAQLVTLEALTAQMNAGLRTPDVPRQRPPSEETETETETAAPADDSGPSALGVTSDPPASHAAEPARKLLPELAPAPRRGSAGTLVLLALVIAFAAFGVWLLRR